MSTRRKSLVWAQHGGEAQRADAQILNNDHLRDSELGVPLKILDYTSLLLLLLLLLLHTP